MGRARGAAAGVAMLALAAFVPAAVPAAAEPVAAAAAGPVVAAPEVADSLRPASGAPRPAAQPAEWETLATGLPEEARLGPLYGFRYNRVDGPALTAGLAVRSEEAPRPLLRAAATYAFSRERLLAEFGADVPVGRRRLVTVGASAYRRTASEDVWIVAEGENTIFALLLRKDFRDYYEAEGFEGHVTVEPGRDAGISAGMRLEDQRSLPVETRVALWGMDDLFRSNPTIEPGEDGVVWGAVRVGPAAIPAKGGSRLEFRYERAGGPIERDFDYGRVRAQGTARQRLAPGQTFCVRAIAGSTRSGRLPAQKVWHLGEIGTLRGEPFKRWSGDQFYLVNAEFAYLFRKNLNALFFLDWGTAWFGRGAWGESRPRIDGGLGIRIADGPATITLARNLQRSDEPILVGLRLGGSWEAP